jgi:hypothetical protein
MGTGLIERWDGKGDAVIEAAAGLAGTTEATAKDEATKGLFGQARGCFCAVPEGVDLVEFMGADGEGIIASGTTEFEERGELVLLILIERASSRDGSWGLESYAGPEGVARHCPGENRREHCMQVL